MNCFWEGERRSHLNLLEQNAAFTALPAKNMCNEDKCRFVLIYLYVPYGAPNTGEKKARKANRG